MNNSIVVVDCCTIQVKILKSWTVVVLLFCGSTIVLKVVALIMNSEYYTLYSIFITNGNTSFIHELQSSCRRCSVVAQNKFFCGSSSWLLVT